MKVLFVSLGCDKNRVDSEYMLGALTQEGFSVTDNEAEADVIVVNTCCFLRDAKDESLDTILAMSAYRTEGPCRALIVCGCLAERYREEIREAFPAVDAVLGTNSTDRILDAVNAAVAGEKFACYQILEAPEHHTAARCVSTGGQYAYLKIAEGCAKHCTYCVIPKVRGPYRSVPIEELVSEAESLAAQGVKELILVAQETTLYGLDLYGEKSLHRLVRRLNDIGSVEWIRLLYCYPEELYPELIETVRDCDKVCHYLDIPIQHCNSRILAKMGRGTDKEHIRDRIAALRSIIPDIALRTTVICGFPGETKQQHEELLEFIDEIKFDRLGAFAYSREDGTPAADFPGQVREKTKQRRRADVMEHEREVIRELNGNWIGRVMRVMIEGHFVDEDAYIGRSYRDAPDVDGCVFVETKEPLLRGDFVDVRITGARDYDLIGEPVGSGQENRL